MSRDEFLDLFERHVARANPAAFLLGAHSIRLLYQGNTYCPITFVLRAERGHSCPSSLYFAAADELDLHHGDALAIAEAADADYSEENMPSYLTDIRNRFK